LMVSAAVYAIMCIGGGLIGSVVPLMQRGGPLWSIAIDVLLASSINLLLFLIFKDNYPRIDSISRGVALFGAPVVLGGIMGFVIFVGAVQMQNYLETSLHENPL